MEKVTRLKPHSFYEDGFIRAGSQRQGQIFLAWKAPVRTAGWGEGGMGRWLRLASMQLPFGFSSHTHFPESPIFLAMFFSGFWKIFEQLQCYRPTSRGSCLSDFLLFISGIFLYSPRPLSHNVLHLQWICMAPPPVAKEVVKFAGLWRDNDLVWLCVVFWTRLSRRLWTCACCERLFPVRLTSVLTLPTFFFNAQAEID